MFDQQRHGSERGGALKLNGTWDGKLSKLTKKKKKKII
jgi:hypothetical protein